MGGNSVIRTLIGICVSRIGCERTSEIELLVGDLLDFLANEVISGHADTAVSVPVIEREPGAPDTDSSDSDIPSFTEATVLIEIFVESTFGWDKENARKGCKIVGFSHGALSAVGAVISVVSEGEVAIGADTGLSIDGVNLVEKAFDEYALTADESKSSTASTCVKLGEVGLVDGTTLANILDDDKSRETFAESIDKMLVDTTGINANTLLQDGVIFISLSTFTTISIDGDKANIAIAVEGVDVEYLIDSAAIASDVSAITYFHGGFTAWMVTAEVVVVGKSSNCQKQYEEQNFIHPLTKSIQNQEYNDSPQQIQINSSALLRASTSLPLHSLSSHIDIPTLPFLQHYIQPLELPSLYNNINKNSLKLTGFIIKRQQSQSKMTNNLNP